MTSVSGIDAENLTAPIPVINGRPRWRDTAIALRSYNDRAYVIGQLFANTGGWMARIAIDWLVLELTGNVALVGIVVALQFAPTIVLGAWAGVLSDRANRHRVLMATQSVGLVSNAVLALLVLLGAVEVWHVFLVATTTGIAMAIDGPSRSAFVSEMVGTARLRNAISVNAMIFHLGGLVGPAISGVLIVAVGSGWSIAINAATASVALTTLLVIRTHELHRAPRQARGGGQIREALAYAMRKPTILWPIVLLGFVAVFGMNLPVLFTAAATSFGTGAAGYGLYSSLAAVGALIGAVLSAQRRSLRLRAIVIATIGYGLVTALAGVALWYPLFLGALVGIGITRLLFATGAESMTQLSTNPGIRGRIMSFYFMVVVGGQALGGVIMGFIAEHLGAHVAFMVAGGVPALAGVVIAVVLARRHQLRIRVNIRTPRRLVRIVPRGQSILES
jgi:MFS family permease